MKNYLAIIRRADFIDFYKTGTFYIDKHRIVEFDCLVSELPGRNDIFDCLFDKMNTFEKSFAYLIIHYEKENYLEDFYKVFIEEVKHVYPLDIEAKHEFENSFDEHIKIENPLWNDASSIIEKKQLVDNSIRGINNIFKIFKLDGLNKCQSIISDDLIETMLGDVYDDRRPKGELSLWCYLMRYERHSFYPNDSLGFFMDVVHVFVNYLSKEEVDDSRVEATMIYQILNSYNGKGYKSDTIIKLLQNDSGASAFISRINDTVPEINFILTAVSYLKLRDLYKDGFSYKEDYIEKCKKTFGECFTLAAYMLGIALGHDKTYSCLYDMLPLPIYKSKEEMAIIHRRKEQERVKARIEMERYERERERERLEREYRKNNRKKGKKGEYIDPFVKYGPQFNNGSQYYGNYSTLVNIVQNDKSLNSDKSVEVANKQEYSVNAELKGREQNLFSQDKQSSEILNNLNFPLTLQKLTKRGTPYKKRIYVIVNTFDEYQSYINKKDECWEIKK